jgi:hypothetical protein
MQTGLNSISQYAPVSIENGNTSPKKETKTEEIQPILKELKQAFNDDNLDRVESLLDVLDDYFTKQQLRPLRNAAQDFDFRGGENATTELAAKSGIALE